MQSRKGIVVSAVLSGLALIATTAAAYGYHYSDGVVYAKNGEELAAGILKANSNSNIKYIKCVSYHGCDVKGSLPSYTGPQRLKIDGYGSTIDASGVTDADAFAATGGGSLKLMRLRFVGGLTGVYVEVPADQAETLRVDLWRVAVSKAALHGVYISDAANAPAGVRLGIYASHFEGNGLKEDGQDGVYVDETGEGRVAARVLYSTFRGNGSDGLSLDEGGAGDVAVMIAKSRFIENGPNPANPLDLDDGLDIDETGAGDVWLVVYRSRFNKNFDDGIDIDERGEGHLYSRLNHVRATGNLDQGVTYDERSDGNFLVKMKDSIVEGNDATGENIDIRGRQANAGSGSLTLENVIYGQVDLTGVELIILP